MPPEQKQHENYAKTEELLDAQIPQGILNEIATLQRIHREIEVDLLCDDAGIALELSVNLRSNGQRLLYENIAEFRKIEKKHNANMEATDKHKRGILADPETQRLLEEVVLNKSVSYN